MNIDLKKVPTAIAPILAVCKRYLTFGFFVIVASLLGFLLFQVNSLTAQTPDEDLVTEKLQTVTRPRIDQATVNKIKQLEDQNLQVQSLFDEARNNPFDE